MVTANTATHSPETNSDPIIITTNAVEKVYSLMEAEGNLNLKLRIFVSGGGCSGFQYGFSFEEEIAFDDIVIERQWTDSKTSNLHIVKFLVDAMSLQYLKQARVDYRKDINGEQFIISNPSAKTTCGCGSSFSADLPEDQIN